MADLNTNNDADRTYMQAQLGIGQAKPSNIGTRIFGGRMGTIDNTTPKTFQVIAALAQRYDAVRLVLANSTTSAVNVGAASAWSLPNVPSTGSQSAQFFTFGGSSTGVIPAAPSTARRSFLRSDWLRLSSTDRSDGGVLPLIQVRAYISSAASIGCLGNGGDNFTNWAAHPLGRLWIMRHNDGDCVTTPANFTSTTNRNQSPIVGIEYLARGKVVSVFGFGDSITEGRGTYIGEGWGLPACHALSDMSGTAFEWSNLGWSSQTYLQIADGVADAVAAGFRPSLAFLCCGTPNTAGAPITNANISSMRQNCALSIAALSGVGVPTAIWTMLPSNPNVKDYNSSDSLRRDLNADARTWAARGVIVADFDSILAGITDGDGQVNMLDGSTTDGIHPNDAGNALLVPLAQKAIALSAGFNPGALLV